MLQKANQLPNVHQKASLKIGPWKERQRIIDSLKSIFLCLSDTVNSNSSFSRRYCEDQMDVCKIRVLVDNQRSAMSALAGRVSFLFLPLAIEPLIAFSRTGQDVRHSTSTRCAGLNGLEGRIQLLIFLKVANVGLNVFLIICWYLFLLLLVPCGFHIIHSDPTYLSMPWHLPSALANLPQTQNQI